GRYVTLGALEPKFLANFLDRVGRPELASLHDREALRAELRAIFSARSLQQWIECLDGVDTCFAPVNTLEEALADPQAQALGLFTSLAGLPQLAPPFAFSATPATLRLAPPALGEHSREILSELGLDAATIEGLAERGVVSCEPLTARR